MTYENAVCYLVASEATPNALDPLQRDHADVTHGPYACSARRPTRSQEATAFGQAAADALTLRLQLPAGVEPAPLWRVVLTPCGASVPKTYVVRRVARGYHWELTVEGV